MTNEDGPGDPYGEGKLRPVRKVLKLKGGIKFRVPPIFEAYFEPTLLIELKAEKQKKDKKPVK